MLSHTKEPEETFYHYVCDICKDPNDVEIAGEDNVELLFDIILKDGWQTISVGYGQHEYFIHVCPTCATKEFNL